LTAPFHTLLDAHSRRAQRAALGFLGRPEEAREAAQESLLKAWRARDRYDPSRPFYPWLYRIIKNHCLDQLAKRRIRKPAPVEVERLADSGPDPALAAERAQSRARLYIALQELPEPQREILNLRHFQDLSYAEISQVLEVKEGTVMSRLFRARKALAKQMQQPTPSGGVR
jgi:RNA polymerase sigma-70 factor (ECF subfamily)